MSNLLEGARAVTEKSFMAALDGLREHAPNSVKQVVVRFEHKLETLTLFTTRNVAKLAKIKHDCGLVEHITFDIDDMEL